MAAADPAPSVNRLRAFFGSIRTQVTERRRTRAATKSRGSSKIVYALVASLVILLAVFGFGEAYINNAATPGKQLSLTDVTALAKAGRIHNAIFRDEDSVIVGQADPLGLRSTVADSTLLPTGGKFWMSYPSQGSLTSQLTSALTQSGAQVITDRQSHKQQVRFICQFLLPVLLLANVFALLLTAGKGSQGAIGGVISFGTLDSGRAGESATTFADVGGADEAVIELVEVRDYLKNPEKYQSLGAAPPKGVMLFGPPGTGKTLLAKAVAGEAGVPFFSVAGAQFVESLVGVGAARVRDLFKRVNAVAPAILFIDEVDAVGRRRGAGGGSGGSDEREQTLNQLLVEMDGFEVSTGVVVIAATNRPDILDPALMRPGRFDRHITVERPDADGREIILRIHARNKPLSPSVDLNAIAHRTPGFTGADLASVVNEAALLTIRAGRDTIGASEFEEAIDRVLSGPRRRGRILSVEETRRAALHETGHAVVAAALGHAADVSRVSVLPRARTVAQTTLHPDDAILTASQLTTKLTTFLGGAAAERLVYGEVSTGVEDDLDQATDLARDIAARYGMSPGLGPVRLLARQGNAFLGDVPPIGDLSPKLREALDAEVNRLIVEAENAAHDLLVIHEVALFTIADYIQEHETVDGEKLQELLSLVIVKPRKSSTPGSGRATQARVGITTGATSATPAARAAKVTKAAPAKAKKATPRKAVARKAASAGTRSRTAAKRPTP